MLDRTSAASLDLPCQCAAQWNHVLLCFRTTPLLNEPSALEVVFTNTPSLAKLEQPFAKRLQRREITFP